MGMTDPAEVQDSHSRSTHLDGQVEPVGDGGVRGAAPDGQVPSVSAPPAVRSGLRPPFEPGNEVAVTHGAYAKLKLAPRADELAQDFRRRAPIPTTPTDEPGFAAFGLVAAQLEAASKALEEAGPDELGRLRADVRGWLASFIRYADAFGFTPAARVRLGLDIARTGEALEAHLRTHYDEGKAA